MKKYTVAELIEELCDVPDDYSVYIEDVDTRSINGTEEEFEVSIDHRTESVTIKVRGTL